MKKLILTTLIGVFACSLILIGNPKQAVCAPITLKWTAVFPNLPHTVEANFLRNMVSEIEKQTDGRIKGEIFWGSVLGPPKDYLKMIGGEGVADIGYVIQVFHGSEIPLWCGAGLPFLASGLRIPSLAIWQLYNEWEPMKKEWEKVNCKPLSATAAYPAYLMSKLPPDKLKGKKVMCNEQSIPIIEALGMKNVALSSTEVYEAIQKGVITGNFGNPLLVNTRKYGEVVDYLINFDFAGGNSINPLAINLDVWNKISPRDQRVIEKIAIEAAVWWTEESEKALDSMIEGFTKKGLNVVNLSPLEQETIRSKSAVKAWKIWLAKSKYLRVPGEEFLTRYTSIVQELEQK